MAKLIAGIVLRAASKISAAVGCVSPERTTSRTTLRCRVKTGSLPWVSLIADLLLLAFTVSNYNYSNYKVKEGSEAARRSRPRAGSALL